MKRHLKQTVIAIAFSGVASAMFANAASIEPVDGLNVNQPFYQPEAFVIQKQAPVVDLTGIPVELHGQRIMSQAGKEVELFLANARRKFEVIGLDPIEMSIELTEVFKNSKKLNPEFIGTLESLAQELGIDARELFALSQTDYAVVKLMEKGKKTEVKPGGCTSMAFNSSGVVGQTNDLASLDYGSGIILKKDQSITTMTGFGPAGQSLGKRVGVVINFLGADTQGMDVSDSMATGMGALVDALAKTRSVEEAVELLTTNRTIVGMNFTIADIDGNAASVEVGRDGLLVTIGEKGVAHANHSLREGSEESFRANLGGNFKEQTIASSYSFWRQEAAETFLKHTPEIDVDAMKYIFNQKPIAQSAAYGSDFITVNTVVLDTQSGCMNYAPGIGDWTGYQQVCFNSQH